MISLKLHHINKQLYDALLKKSRIYGWSLEKTTKYLLRKQIGITMMGRESIALRQIL
ncbi:MAG: hypothetical protein UU93_C0003G0053 [Candidatus Amesbacteria bacterium GW2011_GWA2_42_12]|uniref:Uncharacterized protein n=1 Tax=Candidatus Amesbacteria bacterium GW2011_GWA2_42_12 TaxID=1618356 RepID=A0A0G0Y8L5_9BACT|nr:MAG: hypothetical protein UU93_C0003G0053 [Candidatus Amesbacteria bacterium GW2011_GWA2_42_12]